MRSAILNVALLVTLSSAQPHNHGHAHLHQKKSPSPVEQQLDKRVAKVEWVAVTATAYVEDGKEIAAAEAKSGIANGLYIIVGESTPTFTTPAEASCTSSSSQEGGVFIQKVTSSTSTTSATPTSSKAAKASSGATGVTAEFPSGELPCSELPTAYGAVAADWLDIGGYVAIQQVPGYSVGASSISTIVAGVAGDTCTAGSFCSIACPPGYVQTQWPSAQGSTGQSVGGLYCNSDGKLELTRKSYKTLCTPGCGGVTIVNKMSGSSAVCRTNYPGDERMSIPLDVQAGGTYTLTNVESSKFYSWQGKSTTLQYYVNPKDVSVADGCVWDGPSAIHDKVGNWAPIIIGVGKDSAGITYLSIFQNLPTSTAKLDFNIEISGDISGSCSYKNGVYEGTSGTGCTVGIQDGGNAVITFTDQ